MARRIAPRSWHAPALVAILVVALASRVWGLTWGLYDARVQTRPHPDEWTIYWLFQWFGAHHSLDPCPSPSSQCFFDWGTVYLYLAYAVRAVVSPFTALVPASTFGPRADMTFVWTVMSGRITSVLISVATILVVYRIARDVYSPAAGLLAALLAAISGLVVQLAHFATPDTTTLFLVSSTLLAALLVLRGPTGAHFALAGVLWGLSVGSEFHMVLLGVPIVGAWALASRRAPFGHLALSAGCAVGAFFLSNPYVLVHPGAFIAAQEHTLSIRTVDSAAEYGDRWAAYGPAWLYVIRYSLGYGVGFALAAVMVAGVAWAVWKRSKPDLLLLSWLGIYFVLVTLSPAKFMRYSAPLLPVLVVLSGRLIVELAALPRAWVRPLVTGAVACMIGFTILYVSAYLGLFTSPDSRLIATEWLAAQAPAASRVAFEELPNGLINLPYFVTAAGFSPCFAEFRPASLDTSSRYVMVDSYDLEEHPRVSDAQVLAFRQTLTSDRSIRLVHRVDPVPSIFGITFPIADSPHDWRYPGHVISIYRESGPLATPAPACFSSVEAAAAALRPPDVKG